MKNCGYHRLLRMIRSNMMLIKLSNVSGSGQDWTNPADNLISGIGRGVLQQWQLFC